MCTWYAVRCYFEKLLQQAMEDLDAKYVEGGEASKHLNLNFGI